MYGRVGGLEIRIDFLEHERNLWGRAGNQKQNNNSGTPDGIKVIDRPPHPPTQSLDLETEMSVFSDYIANPA